jgi:hypothetical protein
MKGALPQLAGHCEEAKPTRQSRGLALRVADTVESQREDGTGLPAPLRLVARTVSVTATVTVTELVNNGVRDAAGCAMRAALRLARPGAW